MAKPAMAMDDPRRTYRDEVQLRVTAQDDRGRAVSLTLVNLSPLGFMARTEQDFDEGAKITVMLPAMQGVAAQVRWCLGGRIGGEFADAIPLASYYAFLAGPGRAISPI